MQSSTSPDEKRKTNQKNMKKKGRGRNSTGKQTRDKYKDNKTEK